MDILLADDDPYIIRSLSFVLRKEGFSVETAADGEAALKKARESGPAILFLDIMMPKMNGFAVCRAMKKDEVLRGTYVIGLTAKGQDLDRELMLKEGADEFMTKPFSPRELVARVREIMQARQAR